MRKVEIECTIEVLSPIRVRPEVSIKRIRIVRELKQVAVKRAFKAEQLEFARQGVQQTGNF